MGKQAGALGGKPKHKGATSSGVQGKSRQQGEGEPGAVAGGKKVKKASAIDDIFAKASEAKKEQARKQAVEVQERKAQEEAERQKGKASKRASAASGDKAFAISQERGQYSTKDAFDLDELMPRYKRKKTNEGFAIFKETELRMNKDVAMILGFCAPALCTTLASPILSAIDTVIIGRCASTAELAALGPASTLFDSLGLVFAFLQVVTINKLAGFGSHATEESPEEVSSRVVMEVNLLSAVAGFAGLAVVLLSAGWTMQTMTHGSSEGAVAFSTIYTKIRALSIPGLVCQMTLQGAVMGLAKDTITPLVAVLLSGGVNLVLDVVLVQQLGYGVAGAAWATVAAQYAATFLLARKVSESVELSSPLRIGLAGIVRVLSGLGPLVKDSVPFLLMKLLTCVKVFLISYLSTLFGTSALATHLVAMTIWRCLILVGEPLSFASQTYAREHFAERAGEPLESVLSRRRVGMYYVRLIIGIGAVLSCAMLVAAPAVVRLLPGAFTSDLAVTRGAAGLWKQITLSALVFPVLLAAEGGLLAMGQARNLAISMAANTVIISAAAACLVAAQKPSLPSVWWVFATNDSFYAFLQVTMVYFAGRHLLSLGRGQRQSDPTSANFPENGASGDKLIDSSPSDVTLMTHEP